MTAEVGRVFWTLTLPTEPLVPTWIDPALIRGEPNKGALDGTSPPAGRKTEPSVKDEFRSEGTSTRASFCRTDAGEPLKGHFCRSRSAMATAHTPGLFFSWSFDWRRRRSN